jgi:hypothetical protein
MRLRPLTAIAALLLASPSLLGADAPPAGLRSTGTIVIQANLQGAPLNIGGNVACYRKGNLFRLDLLSLGIPGTSGDLGALATALIGPGGMSAVYDASTGTVTAWSNANRTYYSATRTPRAASSSAPAAAPASSGAADPFTALASVAGTLHDVQTATIQLVGHSPVNGHPATNFDVQVKRQLPGKPLENYHAQLALADDLGEFPLQIAFESVAATPSAFGGKAKLDLTSVQADNPDDAMFRAPDGYRRVDSIGAVFGGNLPGR